MTKLKQLQKLFTENRIISASEIRSAGIPSVLLSQLVRSGEIQRISHGLYTSSNATASETWDYEVIAKRIPSGVFCLESALRFHNLTDENPHELSITLRHGVRYPKVDYPPVKFYICSGKAFSFGIETHICNGTDVKVYSIAKTIADCFKYRNKIGLDIAVASLRDAVNKGVIDYNKLWEAAKVCRVSKIIRPYMEAVQ